MMDRKTILSGVKRVVVKLGTSLSFDPIRGIDPKNLKRLAKEVAQWRKSGLEVVLVASGAVGAGMNRLKQRERPRAIRDKQATAAVGQGVLMDLLSKSFGGKGLAVGQVLISRQDLESGPRYFNARNTLETLLRMGCVPVINENDTVAVDELRFGDNDRLAALMANLVKADLLVILTDVEGLYTEDPRKNPRARRVPLVPTITAKMRASAGAEGSIAGTGGMITKLMAARVCMKHGEHMVIASGRKKGVLTRVLKGEDEGTLFVAAPRARRHYVRWMPFTDKRLSELKLSDTGLKHLRAGRHLFPSDLAGVKGHFAAGDVVRVVDRRGNTWAKGVCRYSSRDCQRLKGLSNLQVEARLGDGHDIEVMHHDDVAFKEAL